jgi:hypothetical protein
MGIQYVARKPIKVGDRTIQPGEVVLAAATWKNVGAYVNSGHLAVALEVPEGAVQDAELKAQVAALSARVADLERLVAGEDGEEGQIEEVAGDTLTGYFDPEELRSWDRAQLVELAADLEIENPGERETEDLIAELVTVPVQAAAEEGEGTGDTRNSTRAQPVDLSNWKLEPLLALAARAGIQDPKFTRKADAVAAIEAATTPKQLADLVATPEDPS